MNPTDLTTAIKAFAGASTADLVGIAPASAFGAEELGDLGRSFGPIQSVVVLAQHIVDPVLTVRFYSGKSQAESLIAASLGDALLRHACWLVAEILQSAGHKAAIPRNLRYGVDGPRHSISYKKAGVLAGLGIFGRNQLLIHPGWGPWLHLRTVVTDAVLPPDTPIDFSPCEGCTCCISACPSGALSEEGFNRQPCEQTVGYRRASPSVLRLSPHAQINCEECMRACPIGTAPPRFTSGAEKP